MKSPFRMVCLTLLALALALPARAGDKIDPATYICAELLASAVSGEPPLFEGLQLDGYAAAKNGTDVADPAIMADVLLEVFDACQARPADTVAGIWQEVRKRHPVASDGPWRAGKTTCKDYAANEDDGSGFVIWLDGYRRGKSNDGTSVLESDETLDGYLDACRKRPDALMLDVLNERTR